MQKKKNYAKLALALHKKLGGKIRTIPAIRVTNRDQLSTIYTPGVGFVSSFLAKNKSKTREYTMKGRTIAIVSDGSAVLGLGNLGPEGAIPVMEGKAVLFKSFADLEAFPIVLDTQDPKEIIETVIRIAPMFGGINLEDIAAPKCFEIEEAIKAALDIPVMHDDQHGTAIVVVAGLINAATVVGKKLSAMTVVVSGAGAAGTAVAKLLKLANVGDVLVLDSKGIISKSRKDLSPHKKVLAMLTNKEGMTGVPAENAQGAGGDSPLRAAHRPEARSSGPRSSGGHQAHLRDPRRLHGRACQGRRQGHRRQASARRGQVNQDRSGEPALREISGRRSGRGRYGARAGPPGRGDGRLILSRC